jgi:mRNA-degrading endonuclease RelE of RelBE toxin-antitoxin system
VYRVIYRVLEKQKKVEVLHIRHSARRSLTTTNFG